jgi:uncharacterized protein YjiS (DUF1127 family)
MRDSAANCSVLHGGDAERHRRYAAELVALAPDAILASSSPAVGPLLRATRTIPIVFTAVTDPVGAGFVDSLARPDHATLAVMLSRDPPSLTSRSRHSSCLEARIIVWVADAITVIRQLRQRVWQRYELSRLSERELRDAGITISEALWEVRKPWWRA